MVTVVFFSVSFVEASMVDIRTEYTLLTAANVVVGGAFIGHAIITYSLLEAGLGLVFFTIAWMLHSITDVIAKE